MAADFLVGFLVGLFLAGFLAAGFFAVGFLSASFFATGFLAEVFFASGFLTAGFFADFLAEDFFGLATGSLFAAGFYSANEQRWIESASGQCTAVMAASNPPRPA